MHHIANKTMHLKSIDEDILVEDRQPVSKTFRQYPYF